MRKITLVFLLMIALIALVGCSSEEKYEFNSSELLDVEQSINVFKSTESPKGKSVSLLARVFSSTTDDGVTYYQAFAEHDSSDTSVMIKLPEDDTTKLKDGDFISGNGVVFGVMKGTNAFGAEVSSPVVAINEYSAGGYADIVAKVQKTLQINQKQIQNGLEISVEKIDFTDYDTRLYLNVNNNSEDNISIYSFGTKIVSNGKNYTEEYNFDIEYEELDSDLSPKTSTKGIIGYLPMDYNNLGDIKIIIEAPYSDNWDVDFVDYVFDIKV